MFSVGIISGSPDQVALAANPVLEEILAILTDEQSGNQAISDDISAIDSRLSSIESRLSSIESELQALCSPTAEVCDGIDNDCDGSVDEGDVCVVPECNAVNCATCASDDPNVCEACEDGFFMDSTGQCTLQSTEICTDGIDNDGDGAVDFSDSDCPMLDKTYHIILDTPISCSGFPNSVFITDFNADFKQIGFDELAITITLGTDTFGLFGNVHPIDHSFQTTHDSESGTIFMLGDINEDITGAINMEVNVQSLNAHCNGDASFTGTEIP